MATETLSDTEKNLKGRELSRPNAEFIERCQIEYARNPSSRVFAPLCEAYRRMGLLDEAFELAERGVRMHPDFAAGHIALARIFIEKKLFDQAVSELTLAAELSPDNILAFQLLGETQMELRRPKEALKAFKMVLFLNPLHDRAQAMVRKWEFLTADEFEDEAFEWSSNSSNADVAPANKAPPSENPPSTIGSSSSRADRQANRALSLADALTVRNDLDGAFKTLVQALRLLGARPDIEQRLLLLGRRLGLSPADVQALVAATPPTKATDAVKDKRKQKLQGLLKRLKS